MAFDATDHRTQWRPAPRPEWVQRINEEGACMDIRSVVPLDEDSLLRSAIQATGLSDFGADDWREPFRVLMRAMEEEAALNLMGRLRTRSEILQLLTARLQIEDWYKRHPEIDDEVIRQPVIVVGQGRSGTSFLLNVLAANPDNGALMQWMAIFPCPPPETAHLHDDPRIAKAHALIDQWNRVTPELASMHEFAGDVPQENCQILGLNFMSPSWFGSLGQVPSYDRYMMTQDPMLALAYEKRVLKLLQWRNPRAHWVLKDPLHLDRLPWVMRTYPDACIAWTHRDPVRALASTVSLIGTIHWGRSDEPFRGDGFAAVVDPTLSAQRLNGFADMIESGVVPERQFFNIQYRDLVTDTMGVVEGMYRHFGLELSAQGRAAIAKYLADNPRDARPPHRFSLGSDETVARVRAAFHRYQDYFKVPSE